MTSKLKWRQDGYLHFAHEITGHWVIEQLRGRYILTLDLPGTCDATQDMGTYPSLAKAKTAAQSKHRILNRDFFSVVKKVRRHKKAGY